MDYKRANRVFLYIIVVSILFAVAYSVWYLLTGSDLNVIVNNLLSEAVVLIPALAAVLISRAPIGTVIPLKRIKAGSAALCVIYGVLLLPIATFTTSVSMLFVKNTVNSMAVEILQMPWWQMLFSIGIFGPFVEEIIFRGIFLNSYQRTGRIIASIILSSVLFGIMHMNFSQFFYGVLLGILLALLVEATGSVLSSFIAHAAFNSIEVIGMYAAKDAFKDAASVVERLEASSSTYITIAVYFVAAVICTAICLCIIYKMAEIEGRRPFLESIFHREIRTRLVTVPLVIGIVLAVAFMIIVEVLSRIAAGL